jgi:hypothetical protein
MLIIVLKELAHVIILGGQLQPIFPLFPQLVVTMLIMSKMTRIKKNLVLVASVKFSVQTRDQQLIPLL